MKRFFAGGNTAKGFTNLYGQVADGTREGMTFYLKGGAGVGKSTLIRRVGDSIVREGAEVEYFVCSGDTSSMDGVYMPQLNIAVIDGTSPHMCDPHVVGIDSCIVNLGQYVSPSAVRGNRAHLSNMLEGKRAYFGEAYGILSAAGVLLRENVETVNVHTFKGALLAEVEKTKKMLLEMPIRENENVRMRRKLFLSANTPEGEVVMNNCTDTHIGVITVGEGRGHAEEYLRLLSDALPYEPLELYCDALLPDVLSGIYAPMRKCLITEWRGEQNTSLAHISLTACRDSYLATRQTYIDANTEDITHLTHRACESMQYAKRVHLSIETLFSESIDWSGIDEETQKIIEYVRMSWVRYRAVV